MPFAPSSLRLTGATVLRDDALQHRSVVIEEGCISKGPLPEVDLSGYYILPGIIDLHSGTFERHLAPRPGVPFPIRAALRATDRDAAAHGVTTAWLAHGWSWEGGTRSPDHAEAFLQAVDDYATETLTDLRVQIRCETHMVDSADRLLAAVRRHRVDYVVFNNHLDEAVQLLETDRARLEDRARETGQRVEDHLARVLAARDQKREVPRFLCRLAEAFDALGVVYGSHGDTDGETREYFSRIGATVSEFPTRRAAAALARAVGDPIVLGAPDVVRDSPDGGNVSALTLIEDRLCDALVSDFYHPALMQSAFRLVDEGVMDLPGAWAMISTRPADILRLPDRGVIDYGRRADLVVVNARTRAVEATISAGRITHLSGEAAHRFLGAGSWLRLAAE